MKDNMVTPLIIMLWLPSYLSYMIPDTSEICEWDIYSCYVPYDIRVSYKFICSNNEQCPTNFKCCRHRCFVHNICQPYKQILTVPPQEIVKSRIVHPGECNILLNCGILPINFIKSFECQEDDNCPIHYKCCYLECYNTKICQPAKNEHIYVETVVEITQPTAKSMIVPSIVFEEVTKISTEDTSLSVLTENPSTLGTPLFTTRKQELTTEITPNVTSLSTDEKTEIKITSIENTVKSMYTSRTESTTKRISDNEEVNEPDNNINIPVTSTRVIMTTATLNDTGRKTTTKIISDDEDMDIESSGDDTVSISNIHEMMTTTKIGDTRTVFTTKPVYDEEATNLEGSGDEEESTINVPTHIVTTLTKKDNTNSEHATNTLSDEDITFESSGDEDGYHPTDSEEVFSGEQLIEPITIPTINIVNIISKTHDAHTPFTTTTETAIKTIVDGEDIFENSGDEDIYHPTTNVITTVPTHSLSEMQVTISAGTVTDGERISTDNSKNEYFVNKTSENHVVENSGNEDGAKVIASVGTVALSTKQTAELKVSTEAKFTTRKSFDDDEVVVFESSGDDNGRTDLVSQQIYDDDVVVFESSGDDNGRTELVSQQIYDDEDIIEGSG